MVGRKLLVLLLFTGWLLMCATSILLALESTRAEVGQRLAEQGRQQAAQLAHQMVQLQQHMAGLGGQFTGSKAAQIPAWALSMVLWRFPMVEQVAVVSGNEHSLQVRQMVPKGDGQDAPADLARLPAVAAWLPQWQQGPHLVPALEGGSGSTRLLALYPLPQAGSPLAFAVWFDPQRAMSPPEDERVLRQLRLQAPPRPAASCWGPVQVRLPLDVAGQRYWLQLSRPLLPADFRLRLWLPLLLVQGMALLLLVGAVRERRQLQAQQAAAAALP